MAISENCDPIGSFEYTMAAQRMIAELRPHDDHVGVRDGLPDLIAVDDRPLEEPLVQLASILNEAAL